MTTTAAPASARPHPQRALRAGAPARWDRRAWLFATVAVLAWSLGRAGLDIPAQVNERGWGQVGDFFSAMVSPDLSSEFLRLTIEQAGVTVCYALLGTALSLVIGVAGGLVLAERLWAPLGATAGSPWARWAWRGCRVAFAVPRSMHEVVFGLLLVNVLGLDPLVAVLAIGIPFGAVTAKVFSELLDEAPRDAERALRAAGAGRLTAVVYGALPHAAGDLLSYGFYRFECAIRSAAVLGIVGAGGLGFQLALSFQSLRYDEMWTLLWALVAVSGIADHWSAVVRRRRSPAVEMHVDRMRRGVPRRDPVLLASAAVCAAALPVAWWWIGVDVTALWSGRARDLARELVSEAWPPRLGAGGLSSLVDDTADTVALAVLALALAWTLASLVAFVARRPPARADRSAAGVAAGIAGRWLCTGVGLACRFVLLIARSVPPPVWAFLAVFVFFPGLWPGAIALGIYNLGVLGRLEAEVVENLDHRSSLALRAGGAGLLGAWAYATVPAVSGRFVALGLYRWEVAIRETVMVGVVGAAGLGRRLDEQTSTFDCRGILGTLLALLVVTVAADLASATIRRTLR
jgi:phosphonate transport system permease protein